MAISTKEPTSGDPVYDSFIRRSLGAYLPDCIKQLSENRPADPIEFISHSLYKAMDTQLYKREKEKYLQDCLKQSELLRAERDERKARMDVLLAAHKDNTEKLRAAREAEIAALTALIRYAQETGGDISPRLLRRLKAVTDESTQALNEDKPLLTMKIGKKGQGQWVEVEEQVTTASGTVITVKTRKWQGAEKTEEKKKKKHKLHDLSSVFTDEMRSSWGSQGTIALTERGIFTFQNGTIGTVQPPDPLDKQLAPADNPDIWARNNFDCHTLYDHELYIRCDAAVGLDKNQHNSPPRTIVREYLESLSRGSSSENEKNQQISSTDPSEAEGGSTDVDGQSTRRRSTRKELSDPGEKL